jgi:hypothetical protein
MKEDQPIIVERTYNAPIEKYGMLLLIKMK